LNFLRATSTFDFVKKVSANTDALTSLEDLGVA
jgi:hypothetical protein